MWGLIVEYTYTGKRNSWLHDNVAFFFINTVIIFQLDGKMIDRFSFGWERFLNSRSLGPLKKNLGSNMFS